MIQMRTLSVSDRSCVPTQPLGLAFSRSNSALISAGHSLRSDRAAFLSSMVRDMGLPPKVAGSIVWFFRIARIAELNGARIEHCDIRPPRHRDRWLDERPVRGPDATPARIC